ncbi:hypothetical protein LCGC14_1245800 [marine sediment metagenome]|uniref:HEAT repeat domain-containing protein n=1 Tax=marine sediment metagenome TaxID=412755 RepID=A0A0F9L8D2_9ZZZZ
MDTKADRLAMTAKLVVGAVVLGVLILLGGWIVRRRESPQARAEAILAKIDHLDDGGVEWSWPFALWQKKQDYPELVRCLDRLAPDVVDTLAAALSHEDSTVQAAAVHALGASGDVRAAIPLAAMLRDPRFPERHAAILALGKIGGPEAIDAIAEVMLSPFERKRVVVRPESPGPRWLTAWLRTVAAEVLGKMGDPRVVDPLIVVTQSDMADHELKVAAYTSLGSIGDDRAVETLLSTMRTGAYREASAATIALGLTGRPELIGPLTDVLGKSNHAALWALAGLGEPAVVRPIIIPYLRNRNRRTRMWAAAALGRLGDHASIGRLEEMASTDPDTYVRKYAADAVRKIRAKTPTTNRSP